MKHTIYEDPVTRKFALVRIPAKYVDGDRLPLPPTTRWLDSHEAAVASLAGLLEEEEDISDP